MTIKFYTLGCKVNQYDTQSIRERFLRAGFRELFNGQAADFCLVNSCAVTSTAQSKSIRLIGRLRRENPRARIILTGCLAEKDAPRLSGAIKRADAVISRRFFSGPGGITGFCGHSRAFVKIEDGCDKFCAYCYVPYLRGRVVSRPIKDVVCEVNGLVRRGFREVVLCGICLGRYGPGRDMGAACVPRKGGAGWLVELIGELEKIAGLRRIRLSSLEPEDVGGELIAKIASSAKLCRHIHLPLQSGDAAVLKKMRRRYTPQQYLALARRLRRAIPLLAITMDVIVGFPAEDEEAFVNTLRLVEQVEPLKAHIFPYSRREGTFAAREFSPRQELPAATMKRRLARLRQLADRCSMSYRRRFLGCKVQVLVEGPCPGQAGMSQGRTDTYMRVVFPSQAPGEKNTMRSVVINEIGEDYCRGTQIMLQN